MCPISRVGSRSASTSPSAACAGWSGTDPPPGRRHGPGRWVAPPPGVAPGTLLTQRRHELEKAEPAAALLAEEYRAQAAEPAVHDLVEVVTGAAAVSRRFLRLQLGASDEVCALVTGSPVAVTGPEHHGRSRPPTVASTTSWSSNGRCSTCAPGVTELTAALNRGERVRVVDRVPAKPVIADRSLALVPLTSRTAEPAALVVHARGLLELLSGLFESVWRDALPLRPGAAKGTVDDGFTEGTPDRPGAADLEILSLLTGGDDPAATGPARVPAGLGHPRPTPLIPPP